MSRGLTVAWALAGLTLTLPLAVMWFTDEVNWSGTDFLAAALLLFVPLGIYTWSSRGSTSSAYRTGFALMLGTAAFTLWAIGAVGITDTRADALYIAALALSAVGAAVARLRAEGMVWVAAGAALATLTAGGVALVTDQVAAHNALIEILAATGFIAAGYIGAAFFFRRAATR